LSKLLCDAYHHQKGGFSSYVSVVAVPETDPLCPFEGENMLNRQWFVPSLALVVLVGGLMINAGCSKTANPASVSTVADPVSNTTQNPAQAVMKNGKRVHAAISVVPSYIPCGFNLENIMEADNDLTTDVADLLSGKTNGLTYYGKTLKNGPNRFKWSYLLDSDYGIKSPEVYYYFYLDQSQLKQARYMNINLCGSNFDTFIRLVQNCGNRELAADDDSACGLPSSIDYNFTKDGIYFIVIDGYDDADYGDYQLNLNTVI
jgi:hypothetical protein